MPNYCENTLIVSSKKRREITRFWKENQITDKNAAKYDYDSGQDLSFICSVPVENRSCDECVEKWGTKWDACDPSATKTPSMITYQFNSAWTPPTRWLEVVAKKYPLLSFEMESMEPGCDYYLHILYEDGVAKMKKEITYEAYLDEKYDISGKTEEILQMIANHPELHRKCAEECENFEEYIDSGEDEEDEELTDVLREITNIMDDYEESDVKYHVCKRIDEHFQKCGSDDSLLLAADLRSAKRVEDD